MAAQTKIYEGIPAGAVFEASQKSLRTLKFTIKKEDSTALSITAKSGMSMKSFGQDVSLIIVEVGPATELTVKTSSGQLSDWGEGKAIVDSIISNIDVEISKIRAEGRISPAAPAVYGMGQISQQKSEPNVESKGKKDSSSGGSWVFRVMAALGHVDKWRSQMRIEVMSMKPRKLSAVLS